MGSPPSWRSMVLGICVAVIAAVALVGIVYLVGNQQPVSGGGMMNSASKDAHLKP